MSGDQGSNNPFIRFKQQVDSRLAQAWCRLSSPPSSSHSIESRQRHIDQHVAGDRQSIILAESLNSGDSNNINGGQNSGQRNQIPNIASISERLRRNHIASWSTFSPYSPSNLTHLRQPTPKDLRPNDKLSLSENAFTFQDAFEDLLLACSDKPLGDLTQPPIEKQTLLDSINAAPFFLSDVLELIGLNRSPSRLVASLEQRKLWDAYFAPSAFGDDAVKTAAQVASEIRDGLLVSAFDAERRVEDLISKAAMCEEERRLHGLLQKLGWAFPLVLLGQLGGDWNGQQEPKVLRELRELQDPWIRRLRENGTEETVPSVPCQALSSREQEPETEQDLMVDIRSQYSDGWPTNLFTWPSIHNREGDRWQRRYVRTAVAAEEPVGTHTTILPDGSKTVRTIERESREGMTYATTKTEKFDADGNLLEQSMTTSQLYSRGWNHEQQEEQTTLSQPREEWEELWKRASSEANWSADETKSKRRDGGRNDGWFWSSK